MNQIPECYYRISVKALILNETRDKFLISKREDEQWELPGGGLDWGEVPQEGLSREIQEEMGLKTLHISDNPSYFVTGQTLNSKTWIANVVYETKLEHLNFTPSDECIEIKFVDKGDLGGLKMFPAVLTLAAMFKPENH